MNNKNYQGPRVPTRPAPAPPAGDRQQNVENPAGSSRRSNINISKFIPHIIRKTNDLGKPPSAAAKKIPPPKPPPPKFPPKKQIVDLLSGSPPSSPSPTLRSQESGFEEDPELWRGWSDSSRSTPLMDWPSETVSTVSLEWPIQSTSQWKSEATTPTAQMVQFSQSSGLVASSSMPTIIRSASSRRCAKQENIVEDDSPPMPSYPPPSPPPELLNMLETSEASSDIPMPWKAVALYDFPATHPDDLELKVGDEVEILSQVDENWFHGRLQWNTGNFPSCFVQILQ